MKRHQAILIAAEWIHKLAPHCNRISIAGSIRREVPEVKDIELVCIPRTVKIPMLFGYALRRDPEFTAILTNEGEGNFIKKMGDPQTGKMVKLWLMDYAINIDLFIATETNWGHILAIRTGSADYSHHVLGSGWRRAGFYSEDGHLMKNGYAVPVTEEEDLFKLIGIPYTEPKDRIWHKN